MNSGPSGMASLFTELAPPIVAILDVPEGLDAGRHELPTYPSPLEARDDPQVVEQDHALLQRLNSSET